VPLRRRWAGSCGLFLVVVSAACSDDSGPALEPDTFSVTLGGARVGSLSGAPNAGVIFTEASGALFAVRMIEQQGPVLHVVVVECAGSAPPAPARYPLAPGAECQAGYSRFGPGASPGSTEDEEADVTEGALTITRAAGDELEGSFHFSGSLLNGDTVIGPLTASGAFRATISP
jgi:hypothetical protein